MALAHNEQTYREIHYVTVPDGIGMRMYIASRTPGFLERSAAQMAAAPSRYAEVEIVTVTERWRGKNGKRHREVIARTPVSPPTGPLGEG